MNFEVVNRTLIPLTDKASALMLCPTERVEYVDLLLSGGYVPYDDECQRYDFSSYGLTALEEEYLCFLRGL